MQESNSEKRAFLTSLVIHLLVFLIITFAGNFKLGNHNKRIEQPIDVVVYDADAGLQKADTGSDKDSFATPKSTGDGGGGGGGTAAPMEKVEIPADAGSDQVTMVDKNKPLVEDTTPFKKTDYNPAYNPPDDVNRQEGGTGYGGTGGGVGGGNGTGIGTGSGSGIGPGEGSGSGGGSGSGNGVRPKVPPRLQAAVNPVYPENLRKKSIEGSVRVRIIVAADGSVESVSVSESSGYDEMDDAAVNAAYNYSFAPAEDADGNAVRCAISATVHFELN